MLAMFLSMTRVIEVRLVDPPPPPPAAIATAFELILYELIEIAAEF